MVKTEKALNGNRSYGGEIVLPERRKSRRAMSREDEAVLIKMANEGVPCLDIAERLGIEITAVYSKIKYLKRAGTLNEKQISAARREYKNKTAANRNGVEVMLNAKEIVLPEAASDEPECEREVERACEEKLAAAEEEKESMRGMIFEYEKEILALKEKLAEARRECERRQLVIDGQIKHNGELREKLQGTQELEARIAEVKELVADNEALKASYGETERRIEQAARVCKAVLAAAIDAMTSAAN